MLKLVDQFRISNDIGLLDELIDKYQSDFLDLDSIYMQQNNQNDASQTLPSPEKSSSSSDYQEPPSIKESYFSTNNNSEVANPN